MGNWIQYSEAESANCVPAEDHNIGSDIGPDVGRIDIGRIDTEYRDAVACLHGIVELSPRTAHRLMKKIVGVYRNLATIADGELE